ncbi:MAG: patatin-like phospholipase family protein [Flavobacteriales bacterium]|nr:patatin-like phospholipase family protein [Flavobacteriales bacterium]
MRLPVLSLVSDKNLNKMLWKYLGDQKIEDLPLPFFATASNLSTAELEILEKGLVRKAVRASISLPTVFPPAVKGNHLLVDGGVFDNLPVIPMMNKADGIRIGVDLTSFKERELGYDEVPSTGAFLKDRFSGKKRFKVPNIFQTAMSTVTLASNEKRVQSIPYLDIHLTPEVSRFGFLNWKNLEKLEEVGYQVAMNAFMDRADLFAIAK